MIKISRIQLLFFALLMILGASCKDNEDVNSIDEYRYYLNIQSEVMLHLSDNAEDESGMVSPEVDRLSRTIYYMRQAVSENESIQGDVRNKEAALLMVCDSLYRNYADMNPETRGEVVCHVKLIRSHLDSDGTVKDAVTLKYYQFWLDNGQSGDDSPSPNPLLAKPDSLQAVDLGLSVLWANCNLGGKQPGDYGARLAWGDPTGSLWSAQGIGWKNNAYTWNTSNYGGINPPADICNSGLDVVTLNWGDGWHMPSYTDARELSEQCQWKLRTNGDLRWYEVIGPNGNSIILPLAGMYGDDLSNTSSRFHAGPYGVNEAGYYWTSTSCDTPATAEARGYGVNSNVVTAWIFRFNSAQGDDFDRSGMFIDYLRAYHMSIRPVHDK